MILETINLIETETQINKGGIGPVNHSESGKNKGTNDLELNSAPESEGVAAFKEHLDSAFEATVIGKEDVSEASLKLVEQELVSLDHVEMKQGNNLPLFTGNLDTVELNTDDLPIKNSINQGDIELISKNQLKLSQQIAIGKSEQLTSQNLKGLNTEKLKADPLTQTTENLINMPVKSIKMPSDEQSSLKLASGISLKDTYGAKPEDLLKNTLNFDKTDVNKVELESGEIQLKNNIKNPFNLQLINQLKGNLEPKNSSAGLIDINSNNQTLLTSFSPALSQANINDSAMINYDTSLNMAIQTTQNSEHSVFKLPINATQEFSNNLSIRIQWMLQQAVKSAEIMLDPPELGPLNVKLSQVGNETQVIFHVTTPNGKELIEDNLAKLKAMLNEQGIDLGEALVNQGDQEESLADTEEQLASEVNQDSSDESQDAVATSSEEKPENYSLLDTYI